MIRHIVMWNCKEEFTPKEKEKVLLEVKTRLEALAEVIPGVVELEVVTGSLPGSNRDLALNSLFESQEALNNYQVHPAHKEASAYVGSVTCNRACIDYEE